MALKKTNKQRSVGFYKKEYENYDDFKKTNKQPNIGDSVVSVYVPKYVVWKGKMRCYKCSYLWTSRRDTPPAKCAKCGSQSIYAIKE